MFKHHDLTKQLNVDHIIDEFPREHPRQMELANLLSEDTEKALLFKYGRIDVETIIMTITL